MASAYQVNQIIATVEREIQFQTTYLQVVSEEQKAVTSHSIDNCYTLAANRDALLSQIAAERTRRQSMMLAIGGEEAPQKLTDFAKVHFSPQDQRRLFPVVEKLKTIVRKVQRESQEFSQVLNFSLGVVSSTLSIIRSANQEVTSAYTPHGIVRNSYHPVGSRAASTLRQA